MKLLPILIAAALLSTGAEAEQCACANVNVHLRSGPGITHNVVHTLLGSQCLTTDGQSQEGGSHTWLHLDYNGQSIWAAAEYLTVQDCDSAQTSQTSDHGSTHVQLPGCPPIITRDEWGARPPKTPPQTMPGVPIYVFIHHGAGTTCFDRESCIHKVQGYQNFHMNDPPSGRGWNDIGYNFVVGQDGNAYEARGWTAVGAHTKGYNTNGIAISVIGDFTDHVPNEAALDTVKQLIQCGLDNGKISPHYTLKGHRDVGTTACPGTAYYNLIQSWPHYVSGTGLWQGN